MPRLYNKLIKILCQIIKKIITITTTSSTTSKAEISKYCHFHTACGKLIHGETAPLLQGFFVFQSIPVSEYVVYHINFQMRAVTK